jgi:hypothetical protein
LTRLTWVFLRLALDGLRGDLEAPKEMGGFLGVGLSHTMAAKILPRDS